MATGEPNQELLKSAELEKFESSETNYDLPGKSLRYTYAHISLIKRRAIF